MRKFSIVDTVSVMNECRDIWNPRVMYNVDQLTMAHEAIASMRDSASAIRHIISRAGEVNAVEYTECPMFKEGVDCAWDEDNATCCGVEPCENIRCKNDINR